MTSEPLVCEGDCMEVMAQMEPDSVDAIVTDPPWKWWRGKKGEAR